MIPPVPNDVCMIWGSKQRRIYHAAILSSGNLFPGLATATGLLNSVLPIPPILLAEGAPKRSRPPRVSAVVAAVGRFDGSRWVRRG